MLKLNWWALKPPFLLHIPHNFCFRSPTTSQSSQITHIQPKSWLIGQRRPRLMCSSPQHSLSLPVNHNVKLLYACLLPSSISAVVQAPLIIDNCPTSQSHREGYLSLSFLSPLKAYRVAHMPPPLLPFVVQAKLFPNSPQSQGLCPSHHPGSPRKQTHHALLQTSTSEGDKRWE